MRRRQPFLKSKKGGIPVINEIVLTVLHSTPKPILILIFLLLLTVIGMFVIPTMLSLFGYSCATSGGVLNLYQVPMNKIIENAFLNLQQGFMSLFGIQQYTLPDDPFPNGDKRFLKIPTQCFIQSKANTSAYGYSAGCVDCPNDANFFQGFYLFKKDLICIGDGYAVPRTSSGYDPEWVSFCNQCIPPSPYYFNYTNCLNNPIINNGVCYFTILPNVSVSSIDTTDFQNTNFLQNIINLGAVVRPQDSTEFVNIQCEDVNKPQIYFFNIKVFDLKLWVYLIIAYGLIFLAYFWYSMSGLHR